MKFVGVIGSGLVGRDPFDRSSWSGISHFFFSECQRQQLLHRAFGADVTGLQKYYLLARNVSTNRRRWRTRFYMDPRYRDALTEAVSQKLESDDFQQSFLQIGAMFDLPRVANGRSLCFSYHDGNMAEAVRSPYFVDGINAEFIERGMAYEREVYRGLRLIFTMSEYLRQSFIQNFDVPPDRVKSVGAGVNLERVPEYFPNKQYDRKDILFIGVDFARKGGWQLLKAFKVVRERHPRARLHIVGPTELPIASDLSAGVVQHGFLSKSEPGMLRKLEQLFRDCSLFAMPSLFEPFGIAPLEAMIHQLPCLVTNAWALKETVIPNRTGDVCEYGSVDDIAEKLIKLLSDPDALQAMGETARNHVLDSYTWEKVVAQIKIHVTRAAKE
jgi:glycosyltransferase involved in cell wall biosynthesis